MVYACCVNGCEERFRPGGSVTFHRFPKDPIKRQLWTISINREGFVPFEYSRVCSKHFTEDCYDRERYGATWLKDDAVPQLCVLELCETNLSTEESTTSTSLFERYLTSQESAASSSSSSTSLHPLLEKNASSKKLSKETSISSKLRLLKENSTVEELTASSSPASTSLFLKHLSLRNASKKTSISCKLKLLKENSTVEDLTTSSSPSSTSLFLQEKSLSKKLKLLKENSSIEESIANKYTDDLEDGDNFKEEVTFSPSTISKVAKPKTELQRCLQKAENEKERLKGVLQVVRKETKQMKSKNSLLKIKVDVLKTYPV